MKKIAIVVVLIVMVLGAGLLVRNRKPQLPPSSQAAKPVPNEAYLGLRNQVLKGKRATFNLPAATGSTGLWGVLMDMGLPDGWATVVVLSDGSPSVYLSNGGGYVHGGSNVPVRKAGQTMVAMAPEFRASAHATTEFPLPPPGQTVFYFLTDAGVFAVGASQDDLGNRRVPLSKLFFAGQDVINEYRRLEQQGPGLPTTQMPATQK